MKIYGNDIHKIIHGDTLEALTKLPDNSVDLIFADHPYNFGKFRVNKFEQGIGLYCKYSKIKSAK